jgi:hypothetical protein
MHHRDVRAEEIHAHPATLKVRAFDVNEVIRSAGLLAA